MIELIFFVCVVGWMFTVGMLIAFAISANSRKEQWVLFGLAFAAWCVWPAILGFVWVFSVEYKK